MRRLHLVAGLVGVLIFLGTGAILVYAFFAEVPKAAPDRVFSALGVLVLALGVLAQLPNGGPAR